MELHRNPRVSLWGLREHSAAQKEEDKGLILSFAHTAVCLWDNLGQAGISALYLVMHCYHMYLQLWRHKEKVNSS